MDGFIFGLFVGWLVFSNTVTNQEKIDYFKEPICVSSKLGKETVKKYYEIREVKEESKSSRPGSFLDQNDDSEPQYSYSRR